MRPIAMGMDVIHFHAMLHNYKTYLHRYERSLRRHAVGNVLEQSIEEIWNKPEHLTFRRRLQEFNFSPCTQCGGCDYFETNETEVHRKAR